MSETKTIFVQRFDESPKEIQVGMSDTVRRAFEIAGITIGSSERITAMSNAADIDSGELTSDGERYVVVGNHTLG